MSDKGYLPSPHSKFVAANSFANRSVNLGPEIELAVEYYTKPVRLGYIQTKSAKHTEIDKRKADPVPNAMVDSAKLITN